MPLVSVFKTFFRQGRDDGAGPERNIAPARAEQVESIPLDLPARDVPAPSARIFAPACIALDLGTSASAVATTLDQSLGIIYANFGNVLGEIGEKLDKRTFPLIGSDVLKPPTRIPERGDPSARPASTYVLGRTAVELNATRPGTAPVSPGLDDLPIYSTSVKRLLDIRHQEGIRDTITGVLLELLLLALCPEHSGTLRAHYHEVSEKSTEDAALQNRYQRHAKDLKVGFPVKVRQALRAQIEDNGLRLLVTIPNSFSFGERTLIRGAAIAALEEMKSPLELRFGDEGPPLEVYLLHEAEAVAWWQFHGYNELASGLSLAGASRVTRGKRERWLVFDMGAGTTDLALLSVGASRPLLRYRSGVPIGGDDIDLLFVRHLANSSTLSCFKDNWEQLTRADHGLEPTTKSFDDLEQEFRVTASGGRLSGDIWGELGDDAFLEGLPYRLRVRLKKLGQECKVAWSSSVSKHAGKAGLSSASILESLFHGTRTSGEEGAPRPLEPMDALAKDIRYKLLPLVQDPAYLLFLYLVTRGCAEALVKQTDFREPVDRVIISGRAARLPMIAEALHYGLAMSGLVTGGKDGTRYEWPLGNLNTPQESSSCDGKLAVVRGAVVFGEYLSRRESSARVQDEVILTARHPGDDLNVALFPQGTPLDHQGRCRKVVTIRDRDPNEGIRRLHIHRQRIPTHVVGELKRLGWAGALSGRLDASRICAKLLARIDCPTEAFTFGIALDDDKDKLELFSEDGHGNLVLRRGRVHYRNETNPITELDEQWLWKGGGAPWTGEEQNDEV